MKTTIRSTAIATAIALFAAAGAFADTLTWIGRGSSPVFSDALNWKSDGSHVVPQNGDTISFSGIGAALSVSNDIANLRVADIQNASAKVVTIDGTLVADTIGTNNHSRYIAAGENGDITVDTIDFSWNGAAMINSTRGVFRIGTGRLVSTSAANQNAYLTDNAESTMPVVVTNGLVDKVDHSQGHNFYLNGNARDTEIVLGPGGLSFEGTAGYVFQVQSGRNVTIHPMADWSLSEGLYVNGDIYIAGNLTIDTTDYYTGEKRTVTFNGCGHFEGATPRLDVCGNGTFVANCTNRIYGAYFTVNVTNTATLQVNGGKYPGKGNINMAGGTTLYLPDSASATAPLCQQGAAYGIAFAAGAMIKLNGLAAGVVPFTTNKLTLPDEGTITLSAGDGETIPDGQYPVFTAQQGIGYSAQELNEKILLAGSALPAQCGFVVSVDGKTAYLMVGSVPSGDFVWTGGANDGNKMATAGNWSNNSVPGTGSKIYFPSASGTIVNDIDGFAPATVTFGTGIADGLTITGYPMTDLVAMTNLSTTVTPVLMNKVAFSDWLEVGQNATAEGDYTVAGTTIRFAGGATGKRVDRYKRMMFNGYFKFENDPENPWWAETSSVEFRHHVMENSFVDSPYLGRQHGLNIFPGAAVTSAVATVESGLRVWAWNRGDYVITNELIVPTVAADTYTGWAFGSTSRIEKITIGGNNSSTKYFRFGNRYTAGHHTFYIGRGGLNFASGAVRASYCMGHGDRADFLTLRPWYSDFTIGDSAPASCGFLITRDCIINTDDEKGVGRTMTFNCVVSWNYPAKISGSGTVRYNSVNTHSGTLNVGDTATLALGAGAKSGTGALTIGSGARLLAAEPVSSSAAVGGALTLNTAATLAISNLTSGVTALTAPSLTVGDVAILSLENTSGAVLENGDYTVLATTSAMAATVPGAFAVTGSAIAGKSATLSLDGTSKNLVLTIADGTTPGGPSGSFVWTGAGNGTRFSDGANWLGGDPPSGAVDSLSFASNSDVTLLSDIPGLAPSKINFSGTGTIVISGECGLTGLTEMANYSISATPVINVPVEFAGQIVLKQPNASSQTDITVSGATIRFEGGVKGQNVNGAVYQALNGHFTFDTDAEHPWTSTLTAGGNRVHVMENSTLNVPHIGDLSGLDVGAGGAFTGGVQTIAITANYIRFWAYNAGEYVITNELKLTGMTKNLFTGWAYDSVGKFEKITIGGSSAVWCYLGNNNLKAEHEFFIGDGGLNYESTDTACGYVTTGASGDKLTLRPWHNGFQVGTAEIPGVRAFAICNTTVFDTDNEAGEGKTMTFNTVASDKGTLTVRGKGMVRYNAANTHSGAVTVTNTATLAVGPAGKTGTGALTMRAGTTFKFFDGVASQTPSSLTLPADGSKVTVAFDGDTLPDGVYTLFTTTSAMADTVPGAITLAGSALAGASPERTLYLSSNKKSLMLSVGVSGAAVSEYMWTGLAGDGKMSTPGNWAGGAVPSAGGEAVFFMDASGEIVNDLPAFAPASITFGTDIAEGLTISGNAITGIGTVVNLSSTVTPVINARVEFADAITVTKTARYNNDNISIANPRPITGANVDFAGGVSGTSITSQSSANIVKGHLYRSGTNFSASSSVNNRWIVDDNSSITTDGATDTTQIYICHGGAFTTGVQNVSGGSKAFDKRLCLANRGEYVITNELTVSSKYDKIMAWSYYLQPDEPLPAYKIEKATNGMPQNWFFFGSSAVVGTNEVFIGKGGLTFSATSGTTAYALNNSGDGNRLILRPWYSDFTVERGLGRTAVAELMINRSAEFLTDDESGIGRTITLDGRVNFLHPETSVVSGSGTLVVNTTAYGTVAAPIEVKDTATLKFGNAAATFSPAGDYTFHAGTTLALPAAGSGAVAFGGSVYFAGEGTVGLKLGDGETIANGTYELLRVAGAIDNSYESRFRLVNDTESESLLLAMGDKLLLVVGGYAGGDYIWSGDANDGKMSSPGNWLGGAAPVSGGETVVIPAATGEIVNDIDGFAPKSITFGKGVRDLTLSGKAISNISAITNLATGVHPVIAASVSYADGAAVDLPHAEGTYVDFAGGLTGLALPAETGWYKGVFTLTSDAAWGSFNKEVYFLSGTAENPTCAKFKRIENMSCINIYENAIVDAEDFVHSSGTRYMTTRNDGLLKIGTYTNTGSDNYTWHANAAYTGMFEISNIMYGAASWFRMTGGTSNPRQEGRFIIGAGGINFTTPGNNANTFFDICKGNVRLYPKADYSIEPNPNRKAIGDVVFDPWSATVPTELEISTTDYYTAEPRTITFNAKLSRYGSNLAYFTISGNGKLVFNSSESDYAGDTMVKSGATLAVKPGAVIGSGDIYLASGASLAVLASGEEVAVTNAVTFADGSSLAYNFTNVDSAPCFDFTGGSLAAAGKINLKITADENVYPRSLSGRWLVAKGVGDISSAFGFDDPSAPMPSWVEGLYFDGGDMYLVVKRPGLSISVR